MIKILHVISDQNIGGAGKLLLNLLAEADRQKFELYVVLPPKSLLTPRIKELNIEATELVLSPRNLCKIIKAQKPDIVHTHAAAVARIAARICGVPATVNTKHCAVFEGKRPPLYKRASTGLFDKLFTDLNIATAEYVKERMILNGIQETKISVIINGSLPIKELSGAEKQAVRKKLGYHGNDFLVGMVARLEKGKGQEIFIEAAKLCKKGHPTIKFLIAGSGAMEEELKKSAFGLDNVNFLGFLTDVTEIMNILDANANCSYISETSSLSLSEGMSVGAVPIVSDCGGNRFMAKDCGIIIPPKDAHALADAIISLAENREKLNSLKKLSKERFFDRFTAEAMAKETENLYFKLLK